MAQIDKRHKGYLVLSTGRIFEGAVFGALQTNGETFGSGEVVFNTSITGYQEILSDPSYEGQIVAMTASHIGNTGINEEDMESNRVYLSGFIIQELSGIVSNWRSTGSLHDFLVKHNIGGLMNVDTRALTRHIREEGAVMGIMATSLDNKEELLQKAKNLPQMGGQNLVKNVSSSKSYSWKSTLSPWEAITINKQKATNSKKVVVLDFGVKQNILRCLTDRNCEVTVVPADTSPEEILKMNPDGIMLSNGPGDPSAVSNVISNLKVLIQENIDRKSRKKNTIPMFGICLGHQLLGLALGGKTFKLKFGHHGANHPIKEIETGHVDVTTQNHGFAVEGEKGKTEWLIKGNKDVLVTHLNLNDQSIAGLRHKSIPLFSVQYHPEAAAGPHDAQHLFDRFIKLMEENN